MEARRGEPVVVWVGERPKYLAWPFAGESGQLKVKIAGEIPRWQEERYGNES